jgi:membrane protein implicated in regulation of membrane protease activity
MTGTPLDLTPFGAVLQGIGLLYWLAVLAALALVLWKVRGWPWKALLATGVLTTMVGPVAIHVMRTNREQQQTKAKLDEAMARFKARCESAGEKINRTVVNVDGVVWMKWREEISNADNFADQFKLNDPYGQDCGAEDCILRLLRATKGLELDPKRELPYHQGYRFVETRDPRDGLLYRYTLRLDRPFDHDHKWLESLIKPELDREVISRVTARYGVTWDDISTREDREHWIAGSSLKIIDLQTNEVNAERVGYMVDQGQGSQEGFRSPWLYAEQFACPEFAQIGPSDSRRRHSGRETRDFTSKMLQPTTGE